MKWERQLNLTLAPTPVPILNFSREQHQIARTVNTLSGEQFVTSIATNTLSDNDLADQFTKAWLKSQSRLWDSGTGGEIKIVDLFSGCGGMSLGLEEACRALGKSPVHVFAAELDPTYAAVYARNFNPAIQHVGDVTEIFSGVLGAGLTERENELRNNLGRVDILCGGPPCQGHSDLNNYTRRRDPRNSLYDRMARAAEILSPRAVIIENVPGVQRDRTGVFTRTVEFLAKLGYDVSVTTLDASALGVPQSRKRTFVLALQSARHQEHFRNIIGQLTQKRIRNVQWAIDDLSVETHEFDRPSTLSAESQKRVDWLFETNSFELPDSMRPDCHRLKQHTYKSVYGRMYGDRTAPTITTGCLVMGQGRFIHPTEPRTITPHEAARLQTFPDFFDFGIQKRTTYAKLIGNAVPPMLAFAVGLGIASI